MPVVGGTPRILAVAPAAASTGYGRWVRHLLGSLVPGLDVHQIGTGHPTAQACRWSLHHPPSSDPHGFELLPRLAPALRPDLILVLGDTWFLPSVASIARRALPRVPVVVSGPFETPSPGLAQSLECVDGAVLWTRTAAAGLVTQAGRSSLPPLAVIPLGVDRGFGRPGPVTRGQRLAARWRLGVRDAENGFWVLNANRHLPRKRIDLTLRGFARFARDKPASVRLWLHMERRDASTDLWPLVDALGIADRILPDPWTERHPKLPDERLRDLYAACDVGVNTALDEGWGYVAFEHGATGAPQVVPGHGVCRELWEGAATLLPAQERCGSLEVTPEGVAEALEKLYTDRSHRAVTGWLCHCRSWEAQVQWLRGVVSWRRLLDSLLARGSRRHDADLETCRGAS